MDVTDGKQGFPELFLRQARKKVGLIFVAVRSAQQPNAAVILCKPRIVSGRKCRSARPHGKIQKSAELDLAVAQYVRVRRAARPVFRKKIRKHPVAVFLCKIDRIVRDADGVRDPPHIFVIRGRSANAVLGFLFPVFHEHAHHIIALLLEQVCRDRAVNAARHADDDMSLMQENPSSLPKYSTKEGVLATLFLDYAAILPS